MMTSSNGNIFRVAGPFCGEFIGHRWIPCTKASDAELCCFLWDAYINVSVNNREADDLRRYRAHYDVTVMSIILPSVSRVVKQWAQKRFVKAAHNIIFFYSRQINPQTTVKATLARRVRVPFSLYTFCWRRHSRLHDMIYYATRQSWRERGKCILLCQSTYIYPQSNATILVSIYILSLTM